MKIIKFRNKQYFINRTELAKHLRNVIFKNDSESQELSDGFLVEESFDIEESKYVDSHLEYLDSDGVEYEYWHEKLTDTVLDVPIEIVRHWDAAEVCDSFTIKKSNNT
tara:strand:- start:1993 stop:2316 length:324 start_codon:yes stop_codon:yes gene_type:complete